MNKHTNYEEKIAFADLVEIQSESNNTVWTNKLITEFAHPSGRIPSHSAAVGWQPIHIPGTRRLEPVYSSTIYGLVRRVRSNRGEA